MMAEDAAQQVIAQNLANASTTGYKQDIPQFQSFDETLVAASGVDGSDGGGTIGTLGHGAQIAGIATDLSDGPMQATGNSLDVAMRGSAYLQVRTGTGQIAYSRDGSLTLNSKGTLVQTSTGYPVLSGQGQSITAPLSAAGGDKISISPDGSVTAGTDTVGKLGLVSITQANLPTKIGDNLIVVADRPQSIDIAKDPSASVQSGYLEASNVSVVKAMVTMIACQRSYEANAKAMQSQDDMQNKSISQVGAVAA